MRSQSVDSVVGSQKAPSLKERRKSLLCGRENRNPLIASSSTEEPKRPKHELAANQESMKQPLKPTAPARSYPCGRNQLGSNVTMSFNENAPRDPKPQPRSYPHGQNQFKGNLDFGAASSSTSTSTKPKARTYPHAGGFGVQSKETPSPTKRRPSFTSSGASSGNKVDANAILQRCIESRRQEQQFNHSNVKLGTVKEDNSSSVTGTKKKSMGFSTIASIISSATSKIRPSTTKKAITNRGHTQSLGFSHIQFGSSSTTHKTITNRGHPQSFGFSRIQLG
jgi:hypothetical protein